MQQMQLGVVHKLTLPSKSCSLPFSDAATGSGLLTAGAALLAAAADLSGSGCMLMPSSLLLCSLPCLPFFLQTLLQYYT
jgi:hypothetical protein